MNNSEKKEFLFNFLKCTNGDDERRNTINNNEWKDKIPKYLYRYRPLQDSKSESSKNEFAALRNQKIWGSRPSAYTDDTLEIMHATLLSIDLSTFEQDIDNAIEYIFYGTKVLDSFSLQIFDSVKDILIRTKIEVSKQPLSFKQRGLKIKEIRRLLTSAISMERELYRFRDEYIITCFSNKEDSEYMWKEYANNHKGYCLKYDIQKLYENNYFAIPVFYSDKQVDVNKQLDAIFFLKYNKYNMESEWRHIDYWDKTNPKGCLKKIILPEEIICGKAIDKECLQVLKEICNEKGTIRFSIK